MHPHDSRDAPYAPQTRTRCTQTRLSEPRRENPMPEPEDFDRWNRRRTADPQGCVDDLLAQTARQGAAIAELTAKLATLTELATAQETELIKLRPKAQQRLDFEADMPF